MRLTGSTYRPATRSPRRLAQEAFTQMTEIVPAQFADLLSSTALAHIATIGPQGEPQSSPLWFGWDGEFIRFVQEVGKDRKRRNLEREPRVAVSIVDPATPYRYLEIRGTVVAIEPDHDHAFINLMAQKYQGQDTYDSTAEMVVIVIKPERVTHMG